MVAAISVPRRGCCYFRECYSGTRRELTPSALLARPGQIFSKHVKMSESKLDTNIVVRDGDNCIICQHGKAKEDSFLQKPSYKPKGRGPHQEKEVPLLFSVCKFIVGLDVEWRPSYGRQQNPVALLQLCVGRRCLIFQLLHADFVPRALERFLADPDFRFVGVGVQEDASRLSNDHDLYVSNTEDLRGLAADEMRKPELRRAGLQAVARAVMGANLQKPQHVRMGPWDAECLSDEQIEYACIDAFVSFEVGRKLLTGDY